VADTSLGDRSTPRKHRGGIVGRVTYDQFISDIVRVVEAAGAAIMIVGGLWAVAEYCNSLVRADTRLDAYRKLRQRLGQAILLGLEVLIVGDIVRTIIVDPTIDSVTVLGIIVIIRIVLSFSLEVEIEGTWPWNKWHAQQPSGNKELPGG
jgi:uncharacterized membrane protein